MLVRKPVVVADTSHTPPLKFLLAFGPRGLLCFTPGCCRPCLLLGPELTADRIVMKLFDDELHDEQ
ncbi:hypothetical protein AT984_18250 [Paucibacter sp. KCTC 42545]|nr:hypothetical protein AT984_18250 [Paucibacter sp. KCTC 42545]